MKSKKILNSIALFNEFRERKFVGNENEKYIIEAIEIEAITKFSHIYKSDIERLNQDIFRYMDQKEEKTYEKFTEYLLKSKVIKPLKLNVQGIREKTLQELEELQNAINRKTKNT